MSLTDLTTSVITTTKDREELDRVIQDRNNENRCKRAKDILTHKGFVLDPHDQLIFDCIRNGDLDMMRCILQYIRGVDVNVVDYWFLFLCKEEGIRNRIEMANLLDESGADINKIGLVDIAASCKEVDMVCFLLDNGASCDNIHLVLDHCIWAHDLEMMRVILERCSSDECLDLDILLNTLIGPSYLNTRDEEFVRLMPEMVQLLIKHGAKVDAYGLIGVVESGNLEFLSFLLEKSTEFVAKLELKGVLIKAIQLRQADMVKVLLQNGAPVSKKALKEALFWEDTAIRRLIGNSC